MSDFIDERDLEDAIKMAYDFLANTNDRLEEDVADIVLANDGRNRDAKDFEKHFTTAITYIDLISTEKHNKSVFDNDRDMEDAVGTALTLAVSAMAMADTELNRDLSDREYDEAEEFASKLERMEDQLRDLEESERRGRGRGRDRDRGRDRGRRDDRRSSRSSRRSSRDRETGRSRTSTGYRRGRDDDRDDRRDDRRSSRRDDRDEERRSTRSRSANYGRKDPSKREVEREEEVAAPQVNDDEILLKIPRRAPVKESIVNPDALPDEARSRAFNPTTHGTYAIAGDAGVYRAVLSHEEEEEVENYEAHELSRSLVSHNRTGERVVPIADFRGIKDPSTDDLVDDGDTPREPTIVYGEELSCVSTSERVPTHVLTGMLNEEAEYQVVRMNKYMPFTVMSTIADRVNEEIGDLSTLKRFSEFYNWITKAQEMNEELSSRNVRFAMLGCLNALTEQLTTLANNLFSIVSNIRGMDNFIDDWPKAQAWLVDQQQADVFAAWQELEVQYLRHNLAVLSDDEVNAAIEKGEISAVDTGDKPIKNLWVRAKQFVVLVDGDISGTLQLSDPSLPAKVDFELTPDFHNACLTLVQHRNRNMSMANIIMIDTVGSQYSILANKSQVPVMKVRLL